MNLPTSLSDIQEMQAKLEIQRQIMLEKSLRSDDPNKILEAVKYFKDVEQRDESKIKSYIFDPWDFSRQLGYKNKLTNLSYNTLRRMGRTPIINAIITTRVEQVASFSEPAYNDNGVGFIIRKKTGYLNTEEQKLTKQDEAKIEYITDFIINSGRINNAWHGDSFDTFLRKITRDSLELDQYTFEVVRNRKGLPVEYIATDAATFRLADSFDDDEYRQKERLEVNGYYPSYVQIYNGEPIAEFYPWELAFGIRNHYTDIRLNGYGVSELENIINIITWMLYSDTYNGKFFSQGSAPKGILKVSGSIKESRLQEFKQNWRAMVAGVQNAWKTPVLEADKMDWIDLQKNNRDMEFSKWQEYLIKLACASYKIDPSEIGFPMNGSSDSKPLFEGNNEARLKYSRDKGLQPLLKAIEHKINKYIVNALDSNFEFKFVGLNPENEAEMVELDIKKGAAFMTLKEIRKKYGLSDEIDKDDLILNPYFFQKWAQEKAMEQQGDPMSNEAMQAAYPGDEEEFENYEPELDPEDPFAKAFDNFLEKMD